MNINRFLFSGLITIGFLMLEACSSGKIEIYLSPEGNDHNLGTRAEPLKSLEKTQNLVRELRRNKPGKAVTVYLGGGVYQLEKPLIFTSEDSGTEKTPVIFKAKAGEKPVFSGSRPLISWKEVKDEPELARMDATVHGKVYFVDLNDAGIQDMGDPTALGKRPELFCNGKLQTLARWPNNGFTNAGLAKGKTDLPPTYIGKHGTVEGVFEYIGKRQNRWAAESDARLGGYWYWDWSDEFQTVAKIDTNLSLFYLKEPYHHYGYKDSLRYFGVNLLCEIDEPGEWYLDRKSSRLFWLPPIGVDPNNAEVRLSVFGAPYFVELNNCSYLTLQGISFQEGRGNALLINGGEHCLIADCRIERFGGDGIHVMDGTANGISGCLLNTLGCAGIKVRGGDRKTLTPAGHFVENTVVENFSLFKRTYQPAVHIDGCGIRISHNLFRNSSSSAMRLEGNDCIIEYNRISHVVNESDDQGGLDMFYNPSYQGDTIRYNYWSDISGGTRHGAAGIRLDDMISGVVIFGNLFERCGVLNFGAVQIHGGKDNLVENNLFYKCFAALSSSTWAEERWLKVLDSPVMHKKLYEDVDINSPVYQKKYPLLKNLRKNVNQNRVVNNLMVDCEHMFLKKHKALILNNNDSIVSRDQSIEAFCNPDVLKKHGLKVIPFREIGPKKNQWIKN